MPLFLTVALSVAFAGIFVGWALLERKKSSPRLWAGFIATAISIPLAYFTGMFASSFNDNLCYSEVIGKLQEVQGSGTHMRLPLYGYETSCRELKAALAAHR